jgi:hypothetical protein
MVFCSNGADVEEIRSGVFFLIQIVFSMYLMFMFQAYVSTPNWKVTEVWFLS